MTPSINRLDPAQGPTIPAGSFVTWLTMMARAIEQGGPSDVPCGDCTACCQGSYFIHVAPDESRALARIPAQLLFAAPAAPSGYQILGFDEQGHCPMLSAGTDSGSDSVSGAEPGSEPESGTCTVYQDRPRTCRTYDCRIFAATGLAEPGSDKRAIMRRASRWQFDYADDAERHQHAALLAGARFLVEQADALAPLVPGNASQLAMLVVRLHALLLDLYEEHKPCEQQAQNKQPHATLPVLPAVLARLRVELSRLDQSALF